MKNNTLLTIGLIGIGGYAAYKLMNPISETVGEVGGGIGTAFQGAGESVSDVLTGVTSPFSYASTYMQGQEAITKQRQANLAQIYANDTNVWAQQTGQILAKETASSNIAKVSTEKSQSKLNLAHFNTETTNASLNANKAETTARKTEYGATVGQYLSKTFMPTKEVAQDRRTAVVNTVKKAYTSVISLFTKKK